MTDPLSILVTLLLSLGAATYAQAFEPVAVPKNCSPIVSVEKNSCLVHTYFNCGDEIQITEHENGQPVSLTTYSTDFAVKKLQFLDDDGDTMTFDPETGPKFSLQGLMETGTSTSRRMVHMGETEPSFKVWMSAIYELSGDEITLDGVRFQTGSINMTMSLGGLKMELNGEFLVSRQLGLFLESDYTHSGYDGTQTENFDKPRALHFPGDERFLSPHSRFGCGELTG